MRAIGDSIIMAPPLIITRDEVGELVRLVSVALAETEQAVMS